MEVQQQAAYQQAHRYRARPAMSMQEQTSLRGQERGEDKGERRESAARAEQAARAERLVGRRGYRDRTERGGGCFG
eukprot:766825-Hanusia_phi.AAC.2